MRKRVMCGKNEALTLCLYCSMIPMNISFYIHRMGEWTMLMLGECVFSLVIVDVPDETSEFFFTFYCSILAVVRCII